MTATATSDASEETAKPTGRLARFAPRGVLATAMLFTGGAGLVYEYVLSTVFSYLLGSSIEQFSVTIGIMLMMMGVGGWVQTLFDTRLVERFIIAELVLVLLGGFSPIVLQWAFVNLPDDFGWIKFVYPAFIGLLVGIEIPLMMRINQRFTSNLQSNIAGTLAWDYMGSAIGVIAWLVMLKIYVPITHISFWVAASNLVVAFVAIAFFWKRGLLRGRFSRWLMLVAALFTTVALVAGASNVDSWSKTLSQKLYENPIVFHQTTKYQDIVLTEGPHPQNPTGKGYELFLNGNKQFGPDEAIYHEYLIHPAMKLTPRHDNVLVLGGGDGMAVRELVKYPDVKNITLVDLDPGMIKLATDNPILKKLNKGSFSDARVHSNLTDPGLSAGVTDTGKKQDVLMDTGDTKNVACEETKNGQDRAVSKCTTEPVLEKTASVNIYTVDADRFISQPRDLYDVVVVDLPDPNSVELAKLYSKEFYAKIKRVLSPDGMVVVQATSPYHAKETFLCIMRTMAAAGLNVLPYHDNVPSFGDWGWILGSPTMPGDVMYDRADSLGTFDVPTSEVEASGMSRALIFNKGWLSSSHKEVSTLMAPVVFQYYTYEGWRTD